MIKYLCGTFSRSISAMFSETEMNKSQFFSSPGIIFLTLILITLAFLSARSAAAYWNLVKNWNGMPSGQSDVKYENGNIENSKAQASKSEKTEKNIASKNEGMAARNTDDQIKNEDIRANNTATNDSNSNGKNKSDYNANKSEPAKNLSEGQKNLAADAITYHVFEKLARKASSASITGDFNGWKKNGIPLKKNEDGIWQTRLPLLPGTYSYVYIVDGEEQLDDFSTDFKIKNGRKVSVLTIK